MLVHPTYRKLVNEHSGNADVFFKELDKMGQRLGVPAEWIANIMYKESKFKPYIKNPAPNATASGLIQMIDSNTRALAGLSHDKYRKLTNIQQLPSIEKYFSNHIKSKGKPKDWFDLYIYVFYPAWANKPDTAILAPVAYANNKQTDWDKNGTITKAEFRKWANNQLPEGALLLEKK